MEIGNFKFGFRQKVILVGVIITFLIMFLLISLMPGFDIEKQRAKFLKEENAKLEIIKNEKTETILKVKKLEVIETQLKKCIELNSEVGKLADCDLIFK